VNLTLTGGRQYEARSKLNKGNFDFQIVDITSREEKVAYYFSLPSGVVPSPGRAIEATPAAGA
jgi:hypothetical protein